MCKKNIILAFFLSLIANLSYQQSNINNIVFDLADLTIDYETDSGVLHLEAFKSSLNDVIIESKATDKYGQLNWLSIGHPKLVLTPTVYKNYSLFNLKPEGYDISVELLTHNYRNLFKDVVKRKYNIDIKPEQIVSLIPAKFECKIAFYNEDQTKILINGKAIQLSSFPLRVSFSAPFKTKERISFEEKLKQEILDLEIVCDINSQGKAYRQNTFIISAQQLNQLGLTDEIFGNGQETYVTRNQISSLSSELYQRLNIIEDYQIPESQFSDDFKDEFIKQTSIFINQYVTVDQALAKLSTYDFTEDLKPTVIKQELSKLFTIKKTGSKEQLILNQTQYEKLNTEASNNVGGSASGSFFGISLGGSANYAKSQSSQWEKQNTSFVNQLKELNSYDLNEVEWARNGNIIIPKSIKVSKLARGLFAKNLIFSRIKREYYDAPYQRTYTLNTLNGVYQSDTLKENALRLRQLEKSYEQLNSFSNEINSKTDKIQTNLTNLVEGKNQELIANLSNLNSNIQINLQDIRNNIQKVDIQLNNKINNLDKYQVLKGTWSFTSWGIGGLPTRFLTGSFSRPFKNTPTVFYSIKQYHIGDNRAGLFNIYDESISVNGLSARIIFYGVFYIVGFDIEWIAAGY